jgi:transposase
MLRVERAARLAAEAEAHAGSLLIEKLKLLIKKLRHEQFGQSSERGANCSREDCGAIVRAPQASPPAVAGASAAGAHCLSGARARPEPVLSRLLDHMPS